MFDKSDLIRRLHFQLQISVNCAFTETRREKQHLEKAEPSLIKWQGHQYTFLSLNYLQESWSPSFINPSSANGNPKNFVAKGDSNLSEGIPGNKSAQPTFYQTTKTWVPTFFPFKKIMNLNLSVKEKKKKNPQEIACFTNRPLLWGFLLRKNRNKKKQTNKQKNLY